MNSETTDASTVIKLAPMGAVVSGEHCQPRRCIILLVRILEVGKTTNMVLFQVYTAPTIRTQPEEVGKNRIAGYQGKMFGNQLKMVP